MGADGGAVDLLATAFDVAPDDIAAWRGYVKRRSSLQGPLEQA